MANQQLKRLLRRGPEMEEAEFELLQSRVLSRLAKPTPDPVDDPSVEDVPREPSPPQIGVGTTTNGAGHPTNGTHPEPATAPAVADDRIRSIKVTTYDLPAGAVGVMDQPVLPDWDLAALPMIVRRPARNVTKVTRSNAVTAPERRAQRPAKPPRARPTRPDKQASLAMRESVVPPAALEPTTPPAALEPTATAVAPATRRSRPPARKTPRPRAVAAPVETRVVSIAPAAATMPYCPYCALRLDPPPTTSRRCARCHERIMVKRVDGRVIYLTEASVAVFEAERRRMTNAGRWTRERTRWLKVAATVGAPATRIAKLAAVPISAEVVAAAEALYVTTVEHAFRAARRDRRWEDASRIRRDHAQVVFRFAGSPIPPPETAVSLHREGAAAQLRGIEEMTRQAELVSAGCCEACQADGGQTFKISLELRSPRLPHAGCPKGLCRCDWYLPVRDHSLVRRQLRRRARADQALPPRGS